MIPLFVTEEETKHLRHLLEQDQFWVGRARWPRWLRDARDTDTVAIESMLRADRIAACAWLSQQRHYLYQTVEGELRAPDGWVEDLPLYRGLCPTD